MNEDVVNPHWLHIPLDPLAGLADDDEAVAEYRALDPRDEQALRRIIRAEIAPYVARIDAESRRKIRLAYKYYLSKDESRWDRVYNSMLLPFDHPPYARDFFLWIWQECFPNEDWRIDDLSAFEIKPDIEEPCREMRLSGPDQSNLMNDDDIKGVLLDILCAGLLRIRALGYSGDAEACSLEADHLHNLPQLIRSFSWELLLFYFTVERPAFVSRGPKGVEQFAPLWDRLGKLIERTEKKTERL